MDLTNNQLERYSRQIVLKEIGTSGQMKLLKSKVLVLGAGGLGSTTLLYLAGLGIGTIGIIDYDKVDLTNLHRQIIHDTSSINKLKATSAKEKINKLNSDIQVITFTDKLNKNNIDKILENFEIVVDGLDNFSDKFLVNDHCLKLNKKLIHAGVIGFEGQILTIIPKISACLRCFFPDKEPSDFRQSCKEIGIAGPTVGVLSSIQAIEVLKVILNIGKPLINRVIKYNALDQRFYELKIDGKNKNCPLCNSYRSYVGFTEKVLKHFLW